MRPELLFAYFCTACFVFLTACESGSSKSVMTGDFAEHAETFDGATVKLNYFSRTIDEQVVLGSSVVENGAFEMSFQFEEDVPRTGYLSIKTADNQREYFFNTLIEKNANYTIGIVDEPAMWFRVESDGKYAHIGEMPLEDQIKIRTLEHEFSTLRRAQSQKNDQDASIPPIDVENPEDPAREPSAHAVVLDWESMSCEDYAGEFESFWDRRIGTRQGVQSARFAELRQRLDDLYEQLYTQRFQNILNTSSDPVEQLLVLESSYFLEMDQRILVLEELESALPADVVSERVSPRLERVRGIQQRRQNNAALKLGTHIPTFDITLVDQNAVPLSSVLQENEIVVLDFWDNYCDTCIKSFQNYRTFYSKYADVGFEVVSLSLESSRGEWEEKSKELELPWVNAFAPGGYDGAIRTLFGIEYPRGNFVLDSQGCILKRDLTSDELFDFLGARLGS